MNDTSLPSLASELTQQSAFLTSCNVDSPRLSAEVLLAHALGLERNELLKRLILEPEAIISPQQKKNYATLIQRRSLGEPVAYLTGVKEFYGRNFAVTKETLIPRPETEILIEETLKKAQTFTGPISFADFGTGSGCIGITLGLELPHAKGFMLDKSQEALNVAVENGKALQCGNVKPLLGDLTSPPFSHKALTLIISNPPYVSVTEYEAIDSEVKNYEPKKALVPHYTSSNGLEYFASLASLSQNFLVSQGWLLMEIGYTQGNQVKELLKANGWLYITVVKDLAGLDRVVYAQAP